MMEILEYYNRFQKRLINDYIEGNPRVVAAIMETLKRLPKQAKKILDIGCGIGWSSYVIGTNFPEKTVNAIDLSNESITTAKHLFSSSNIKFDQIDVTKDEFHKFGKFDFIMMLDVLEHVPKGNRNTFMKKIGEILTQDAAIFITCPTVFHQNFLRVNHPEDLQPVDEDITLGVMNELSEIIDAQITYFEHKDIWHTNDYFHCLIQKNPHCVTKDRRSFNFKLEKRSERAERVINSEFIKYFNSGEIEDISNYISNKKAPHIKNRIKAFLKF